MGPFVLFLIVLAVVLTITFFLWGVRIAFWLALNSVVGYFALYALQVFLIDSLVINTWSVLLVAVFGIVGLAGVLGLHWFGFWF